MNKFLICTALLLLTTMVVGEIEFIQQMMIKHPLKKRTMKNWQSEAGAAFLTNKTILNPEIKGSVGMIYAKDTFFSQNYSFTLNLELGSTPEEEKSK